MTTRLVFAGSVLMCLAGLAAADDKKPAPKADAGSGSGAMAVPAPAPPKCRAVEKADATKVMAEAEDKLSTKCTRMLTDKVKETACADTANAGKKVEWVVQFDHMIGKNKLKDGKGSITCPKAKPAPKAKTDVAPKATEAPKATPDAPKAKT
jgi:hypothetical protein